MPSNASSALVMIPAAKASRVRSWHIMPNVSAEQFAAALRFRFELLTGLGWALVTMSEALLPLLA